MRTETPILHSTMLRVFRNFLLLAAAIVFAVSGIGWSYANASTVHDGILGAHHSAPTAITEAPEQHRHEGAHAPHADPQQSNAAAPCTDDSGCGSGHDHVGDTSACCATACHLAIPTSFHWPSVTFVVLSAQMLPADTDGVQASTSRLDRPPKTSSRPIG
ncbi:hypothetical protein EZH22_29275 [Xanthobacter dioxanivorans]|uniref:CopL family metal-binding regulatory protein n=1 Tax=Xanthobacter dioxanivorans TaxID=2528964 RepID=A0A974PNJ7_9HYPH|nr:hypothetical protein [Xanthobacter dioxanivorans]QRG06882.1 hypothetical protein EZH22_29275 [Xanthobacter dioxanivorans]